MFIRLTWVKLKRLLLLLLIPGLWLGYREVRGYFERPQAMLVLGGDTKREDFAAEFARQHPHLPIWISSGSNPEYSMAVFADAGIELNRLHIDHAAVDTVTNFTTLVDRFSARGIKSVYLITSDYHMRRSQIIGEIVFGSRGIHLKPVSVPSRYKAEPLSKSLRDGARAVLWLATGHTGSTLSGRYESRYPGK
ncbi:YdcF family protein [Leptothermofonsia sichuanensis E412]|uniref:YdcF family protein n=1 Tax=Leptothermofonsia sichuanensis TaxID=2917832 RepID=UPI001CA65B8D|nr:YdcF family protein [Leptothermofonsia sichuanensis]QZZ23045.1 YdcF family protein [Leptothermofonsia sichuanensis E412]